MVPSDCEATPATAAAAAATPRHSTTFVAKVGVSGAGVGDCMQELPPRPFARQKDLKPGAKHYTLQGRSGFSKVAVCLNARAFDAKHVPHHMIAELGLSKDGMGGVSVSMRMHWSEKCVVWAAQLLNGCGVPP